MGFAVNLRLDAPAPGALWRGRVAAALFVGVLVAGAWTGAECAPLPRELERAAAAYDRAQEQGDRATLTELLAEDYRLVNSSAETEDKAQLITDFTDPAFHLNPYVVEKPIQTVWADGAVLAGEVHLSGTSGAKAFEVHNMFADVWRLRNGRWQVVFTQVTRFPSK